MSRTMQGCMLALLAAAMAPALASAHVWIGMTPDYAAGSVSLFNLDGFAQRGSAVATVPIGPLERVDVDAFRCRPYGDCCMFTTTDRKSNSWLYNVTVSTGRVSSKTAIPGAIAHNLHLDKATGGAFTVALGADGSTQVVRVLDGTVSPVVDISSYVLANDTVPIGGTTQCSNQNIMWVGVKTSAQHRSDWMLTIDLDAHKITHAEQLVQPLPASMWAKCDNSHNIDTLGGIALLNAAGTEFGYVWLTANGTYVPVETAAVPNSSANLKLSGLLSQPPTWAYFAALYPEGAQPGSDSSGFVAFGNNQGGRSLSVHPIDYYLTGAAAMS